MLPIENMAVMAETVYARLVAPATLDMAHCNLSVMKTNERKTHVAENRYRGSNGVDEINARQDACAVLFWEERHQAGAENSVRQLAEAPQRLYV